MESPYENGVVLEGDDPILYEDDVEIDYETENESSVTHTPSEAEKKYDALYEEVEKRVDQGLDRSAVVHDLDPRGTIRGAFRAEERQRQHAINREGAEAIRRATHDREVARIEATILDPRKRQLALNALLAKERIDAEKRQRRS